MEQGHTGLIVKAVNESYELTRGKLGTDPIASLVHERAARDRVNGIVTLTVR